MILLRSPDERRDIGAKTRAVKQYFVALPTVFNGDRHAPFHANEKLLDPFVRVPAARLPLRHVENYKISLGNERENFAILRV
jgi:hypothetical protein